MGVMRIHFGSLLLGALAVAAVAGVLALTGVFDGSDARGGAATASARAGTGGTLATPAGSVADI